MGALVKPEADLDIVDIIEVDGRQAVRLPAGMHVAAKQLRMVRSGNDIHFSPIPKRIHETPEEIDAWFRSMHELDAGEVIPGGRQQPTLADEERYEHPLIEDESGR